MPERGIESDHNLIRGKDGWLFQTDEWVFDILASDNVSPQWRESVSESIRGRVCHASGCGSGYLLVVSPEKHVIYKDQLPDGVTISPHRAVCEFSATGTRILYPERELSNKVTPTYHPGGSHWNGFGAYLVYRQICIEIGIEPIGPDGLEWDFEGVVPGAWELSDRIKEKSGPWISFKKHGGGRCVFNSGNFSIGNVSVWDRGDPGAPTMVLFRDSFARDLLPLLACSFGRIVAVATNRYLPDIVESEMPDFVITEMAERYLDPSQDLTQKITLLDLSGMSPEEVSLIR